VKTRGILIVVTTIAVSAFVAGCGERPNVTVYKQGSYQGKPDSLPWQSAPFNNNQTEWEKAIKARNNAQNEYLRVGTN
jgi:hypothetical protein